MLLSTRVRMLLAMARSSRLPTDRVSRLRFRVQPWDVDLNVHLTNGRYPQLMDVGRMDVLVRSGQLWPLLRQGYRFIAVEQHLVFRRELKLGQRFELHSEVTGRHRRALVFSQRFLVGDVEHALGAVNVVLLGAHGVASPEVASALWRPEEGSPDEAQVQASAERSSQ